MQVLVSFDAGVWLEQVYVSRKLFLPLSQAGHPFEFAGCNYCNPGHWFWRLWVRDSRIPDAGGARRPGGASDREN